ncbi:hypothetical protein Pcinc_015094 [Petrolisthes cinctipes]|uniref:Uncharacterized protein n=1 Tax=Petrolisthes cinctipes TaxID=88211 RepID=A0AAE1FVQ0_PETCI|nr:hypothetical protein Pcinc_015094 [Petrolisthes cinctipes]
MEEQQKTLEEVLPDLGQDLLIVVVEHLKDEIETSDCKTADTTNKAEVETAHISSVPMAHISSAPMAHTSSAPMAHTSSAPMAHTSSAPKQDDNVMKSNVNPTWAEDYEIPWNKLPQRDLMDTLKKGLLPIPSL